MTSKCQPPPRRTGPPLPRSASTHRRDAGWGPPLAIPHTTPHPPALERTGGGRRGTNYFHRFLIVYILSVHPGGHSFVFYSFPRGKNKIRKAIGSAGVGGEMREAQDDRVGRPGIPTVPQTAQPPSVRFKPPSSGRAQQALHYFYPGLLIQSPCTTYTRSPPVPAFQPPSPHQCRLSNRTSFNPGIYSFV